MLFWSWSCVISSMAFAQNPIWARNDQSLNPKPVHTLRHYTQDGSENLTLELKAWHCYTYTVLLTPHIPIHTCMNYELILLWGTRSPTPFGLKNFYHSLINLQGGSGFKVCQGRETLNIEGECGKMLIKLYTIQRSHYIA